MDELIEPSIDADARRLAAAALAEDGAIDITSEVTIDADLTAVAFLEARSTGILAGVAYADAVVRACALPAVEWSPAPGDAFAAGTRLGMLRGPMRAILRAERPLLNLLQRACGIATVTRAYVDAVRGTGCRVLHTRKTLPGLRAFDVRAVLEGGGALHRLDLARAVMVKDNHWRGLASRGRSLAKARADALAGGVRAFQVEVESESQVRAACAAGATRILVDNQTPGTLRSWAALARALSPGVEVEATGGLDLQSARAFAEAGADFISVGALTHSVRALDIALEISALSEDPPGLS